MNVGDKVREIPKTGILAEIQTTQKLVDGKAVTVTKWVVLLKNPKTGQDDRITYNSENAQIEVVR